MTRFASLSLIALAVLLAACDSQRKQDEFAEDASRPPSGYVNTTETGEILMDDPDDWRTAPLFAGKVRIDPARPNPVSAGNVVIPFSILDFNAIRGGLVLRGFDANGRLIRLAAEPGATQPGGFAFSFNPSLLGSVGLHRLYIFDGADEIVSYGDLLIQ